MSEPMTYGHVYKTQRIETFDEELARLRRVLQGYEQQLIEARKYPSVPSRIAACEGTVDAYTTIIHGLERMRVC